MRGSLNRRSIKKRGILDEKGIVLAARTTPLANRDRARPEPRPGFSCAQSPGLGPGFSKISISSGYTNFWKLKN